MAPIKKIKYAITGGEGQLARSVSKLLDSKDITYRSWTKRELDVSKPESVAELVNFAPTVILNCAAWTQVEDAESHFDKALQINRDGAANVAIAARELNVPLVHISTDYVFSGDSKSPWKIDDQTYPSTKYGESKLLGEISIRNIWPTKSLILRTAWLYGPHGKNFAKTIVKRAITDKANFDVINDQHGQPTSTTDLAERILDVVDQRIPAGIYHSTNSGEATWYEFARELLILSGEQSQRAIPILSSEYPSSCQRPSYSVLDQSSWLAVGLSPLRDWREALYDSYPNILNAVEKELIDG